MQKTLQRSRGHRMHTKERESGTPLSFAKTLLSTTGLSLLLGALLSAALSLCIYFAPDPMTLIRPAGLAASALTALFAGMHLQSKMRGGILVDGMSAGLALMAPMLVLSLLLSPYSSGDTPLIAGLLHAALPALSVMGAWLGEKKCTKPKKRKRK